VRNAEQRGVIADRALALAGTNWLPPKNRAALRIGAFERQRDFG